MASLTSPSTLERNCTGLGFAPLRPLRRWLDGIEFTSYGSARWICRLIPSSCPFERDITLWGRTVHIPALCSINPLYEEVIGLRLRALVCLTEVWGEDATPYIS